MRDGGEGHKEIEKLGKSVEGSPHATMSLNEKKQTMRSYGYEPPPGQADIALGPSPTNKGV